MTENTSLVPLDAPAPFPGFAPLRNDQHEKFAFRRALLMPKAEAYRAAGWTAKDDHAAAGNASRLERRPDVAARIAYLRRHGDEQILHAKRERLEEFLWTVHESNIAALWETVEVEKRDKKGNVILGEDGKPVMVKRQVPKLLSDLPEDVARVVETCGVDENGRVIPKPLFENAGQPGTPQVAWHRRGHWRRWRWRGGSALRCGTDRAIVQPG